MKSIRAIVESLPETLATPEALRGHRVEILYKDLEARPEEESPTLPHFGTVKLAEEPLTFQKKIRSEWD